VIVGLIGAFIGLYPWIRYCEEYYNFTQTPWSIFFGLAHGTTNAAPYAQLGLQHSILNTLQVTLPTATGFPFCPVMEYPFLGDNTPRTLQCSIIQSTWGIGYLVLALVTIILALIVIIKLLRTTHDTKISSQERHQYLVRRTAPLIMATTALLEVISYTLTSGPVWQPGYHASYLIGLVAMTPAIIWPLWNAAAHTWKQRRIWKIVSTYGSRVILIAVAVIMITGTVMAFSEVPEAHATEAQRTALINYLEKMGMTRIRTDYWTCYSLIFASNEKIDCEVVQYQTNAQTGSVSPIPSHNRFAPPHSEDSPFRQAVDTANNNISYMCSTDPHNTDPEYACVAALQTMVKSSPPYRFTKYNFGGYVIYQEHPNATGNVSAQKTKKPAK
jgi:hypothetical protein